LCVCKASSSQPFKVKVIIQIMDKIMVRDRQFSVSIPEEKIKKRVAQVAAQISDDLKDQHPLFLAVLNGSFVFAADLMRGITTPCEISFVRMASYEGTSSTGAVKQLIGLKEDIKDRTVVIVEDIIDSGLTMQHLLNLLAEKQPRAIHIAALLVKPGNLQVKLDIPYCCFEFPNDFIVGYGLDYDGEGRNLPSIYTVTD
jgi:hypoxanthine phosphoribosyltransferase